MSAKFQAAHPPLNAHSIDGRVGDAAARSTPSTNDVAAASASRQTAFWQSSWAMVSVAFAVRVLWIALAHTYRIRTTEHNFGFGWEIGRIAYSLAHGMGFSSPFGGNTGPSAWTAPVYPWIVSLAFRWFGSYSPAAAFSLLTFNSFFAALTCWTIYRTALRVFNRTVAIWSGWIWALLPYTIFWAVRYIWETSLSAFLMSLLFMLTVEMDDDERLSSWIGYGLLWGVAALTNPATLSLLPFAGCWLAYQLHRRGRHWLVPAALSAVIFWMTIMPWLVRNYAAMGHFVFIRDNAGNELRVGNNPLAEGIYVVALHPADNDLVLAKYKRMGEIAFCADQGRLAKEWIAQHPGKFAEITFRRVIFFWDGIPKLSNVEGLAQTKNSLFLATSILAIWGLLLALKRRVHGAFLFAALLIFYPLVYYVCFPQPRYRHPIEPELLILGVYLVSEARPRTAINRSQREFPTSAAGALGVEGLPNPEQDDIVSRFHTLSVIIPVYNERPTILKLLRQVARQPLSLHKELIIVDDCSADGTREFLQNADLPTLLGGNGANTVKLVLHDKNMGKGAGVRTGLEHATGDLVLIQDADLEYDPRDYPALVTPILEGHADAVFGNRFHFGSHRVPRFWRYTLNRLFSAFCNTLTGLQIHDVTACYKVFTRDLLVRLHLRSDRFSVETEMTVKLAKLGARIYEVPIVYHGRTYAEGKKISWSDGVMAVYDLVKYRFRD
jgi:Glycosyl transferase family 2/Dolichyl-phosphate-mannose-protein mannosyltransferase